MQYRKLEPWQMRIDNYEVSRIKEELERRRRLGVCHVLAGYRQRTVAGFLGVHPSSVCRWMKAYGRGGNGAL